MDITLETLRTMTEGAELVREESGAFRFYRFSEAEMKTNANPNRAYAAGVALRFATDATGITLAGFTESLTGVRSYYALEVEVNGVRVGAIRNFTEADAYGSYAEREYLLGDFEETIPLGRGEKQVTVLLPHSVCTTLTRVSLADATHVTPLPARPVLLAYGDSITQGYDALYPSETYAHRLAQTLGCTLVNKALGGATFLPALAQAENGRDTGTLLVAYGTNDWGHLSRETFLRNATGFLDAIRAHYPTSEIFVLSPIWRGDAERETLFGDFADVATALRTLCEGRARLHFIEGIDLVPRKEIFFGDLRLHPSGEGFAHYAANLHREMQKSHI